MGVNFALGLLSSFIVVMLMSKPALADHCFEQVDISMLQWMHKFKVPGAQLSVAKNGKIIYSKGYGISDVEKHPVTTQNLFRIASVSKVFTAVAIWQLVQNGKLKLDDKAFIVLDNLPGPPGTAEDPRLKTISVLNLLDHAGGWDTASAGDAQVIYTRTAADMFAEPRPAKPATIVRFMRGKPLQFDPGSKSAYSNFGFNVLGRLIERTSGATYEDYVKMNLLLPSGITDMEIAKTRLADRRPNEVMYFDGEEEPLLWSVLDNESEQVKWSYGGDFAIETMDSHGGWLGTADDIAKFAGAIGGDGSGPLLAADTLKQMLTPDLKHETANKGTFRAHGVLVNPSKNRWCHVGALNSGSGSVLYSLKNGVTIGANFNHLDYERRGEYFRSIESSVIDSIDTMGL